MSQNSRSSERPSGAPSRRRAEQTAGAGPARVKPAANRAGAVDAVANAKGGRRRREAGEGTNAVQHHPDDSREVSMLDSGKHAERSPYTAGNQ